MEPLKKARLEEMPADHCINNIRVLSADMVQAANSGHPGAPMGCAPMAHLLFGKYMTFNPKNPKFSNRDRFVLSNGHACALLYSMLHLTGYDLSIDDLKAFRQYGSKTPGHPENFVTPGVEVSTGPLGQGISNAVGLAIAEKHLAAVFNKDDFTNVVDHYTYVICGDGCLQEGVSSEASSLAGHLGLGKLIVLYDDNLITIDGHTDLSFTEDVAARYASYNWHVITVADVNDLAAMEAAIDAAKAETSRPTLIKIRTVIGHGSSKEGSHEVHGSPLGATDLAAVKSKFGFNPDESFAVKPEVYDFYRAAADKGAAAEAQWNEMFAAYAAKYPSEAAQFKRRMAGELPDDLVEALPKYSPSDKTVATRNRSGECIKALTHVLPELMGGSADLTPSNVTLLKDVGDFQKNTPAGRYVRFGVREHAMVAIANGMSAHGGVLPYTATFLNFIGYAMGAVRVAALSKLKSLYIMTHDSIGLGEDGPTHQPVETLQALRVLPGLLTFRPADGAETAGSYASALSFQGPSVLALSRQNAPNMPNSCAASVAKGAYVIHEVRTAGSESLAYPTLTVVATGTEVDLAVKAVEALQKTDAVWYRVISMPCAELFDQQPEEYRLSLFMPGSPVLSVEASSVEGWQKYAHASCGIPANYFGLSAPAGKIYEHFGLTVDGVSKNAQQLIAYYTAEGSAQPVAHSLVKRLVFAAPPALH